MSYATFKENTLKMTPSKVVLFKTIENDKKTDEYVEQFRKNHLEAFCLSPIKFEFKNLEVLCKKLSDDFRSNFSGLVITSPRILQILKRLIVQQQLSVECLRRIPCITVGPQTFRRLTEEFGITSLVDNELLNINNAKELASHLKRNQDELAKLIDLDKPLLYPTSDLSTEELKAQLSGTAFRIEKLVCYETLPNDGLNAELDSILKRSAEEKQALTSDAFESEFLFVFFSPSGVKSVQQMAKCINRLDRIMAIAIGPTTKKAIEEQNLNLVATAAKPTPECLLNTVLACLAGGQRTG